MRKIQMAHHAAFPGAPSILVTPANDNGNTGTASSFTFTTFTATAQKGTATSYSWSLSGQSNGTFSFVGGTTSATATVQVTGVANGTTASATVRCDAVVNGISDFDTSAMSYQNTTPAYAADSYFIPLFSTGGVANYGVTQTTVTIVWPTTHRANDIMYLMLKSNNQAIATPTGFTAVYSGTGAGTGGSTTASRVSVFARRATSSSESNVTIADSGDHTGYMYFIVRGATTSNQGLHTSASQNQTTEITSFSMPGFTTSVNNCTVLKFYSLSGDRSTSPNANSSVDNLGYGLTKGGYGYQFTIGNDGTLCYYFGKKLTAGTVSTTTWSTLSSGARNEGLSMAVAPQDPPPTATWTSFSGVTSSDTQVGTAQASFTLMLHGCYIAPGANAGTYVSWAGVLSDYEVLCSVSGSGGSFSGTTGSYINMSTQPQWTLSYGAMNDTAVTRTLTITIRHKTTLTVVINAATVTLYAESSSDPIGGIGGISEIFL